MALTRITKGVIKPNENYDTHNINSTGIVTAIGLDINGNGDISGNLSIGGVLTYEDVTSIDSVGIITAQSDIHVGGGVSAVGVGTFGGLDINGDIDVDGHTNLDNVSIAGVSTHSEGIFLPDVKKITLGNSNDIEIYHDTLHYIKGNNSRSMLIQNDNANIHLQPKTGENALKALPDGSVELYYNNVKSFETTPLGIKVPDSKRLSAGADEDLKIYHNGSTNNFIAVTGGQVLTTNSDSLVFKNADNNETYATFTDDGSVDLYYDNSKKFETTASGTQVTGTFAELQFNCLNGTGKLYKFRASGTNSTGFELVDVTLNQRAYLYHDSTYLGGVHHFHTDGTLQLAIEQGHIRVKRDNSRLQIGASQDLQIYHDGSHSYIDNNTGSLRFRDAGGAEKFRISGTGTQFNDDITLSNDNDKINIGAGNDLKIYHSTFNYIESHNDSEIHINANTGGSVENMAKFKPNGAVELYHNGTKRIETTSSGVKVSGSFPDFIIHDTSTTNDNFRILHNSGGTQLQVDPNNVSSGSYLLASIDGSEKLRIDSSGRLIVNKTSTSLSHKLQVESGGDANAIAIIGRSADDIGELSFYENDASTKLGEIQYRQDHVNFRHRVGDIRFATGGVTEKLRIDSTGRLLLGAGSVALPKGSAAGSMDLDNGNITMCIGGNENSTGRTNSTNKINRITSPHYTNAEEPVALLSSYNINGNNTISYGGGSGQTNASTQHLFYTAANTTTTTGTERLRIHSSGFITTNQCPALDTTAGSINITGGTSGGRIAIQGTTTSAYTNIAELFGFWGTNKVAGFVAQSGADTTNKDDGRLIFYTSDGSGVVQRLRIEKDGTLRAGSGGFTDTDIRLILTNPTTNSGSQMQFQTNTTGSGSSDGLRVGYNGSGGQMWLFENQYLRFATSNNERVVIDQYGAIQHKRSDNTTRWDVEFRQTGGISTGNYGGIKWTQNSTGGVHLAGIKLAYHDTGRPDLVFSQRNRGGGTGEQESMRIDRNGAIGINNSSPECRSGGIDMSSNEGTSGKTFTDMRGHSQVIIRNPATTHHSFTQLLFENGGGTSAATMFRHRLGSAHGSLQNFVGDLCLFRRTGNAGGSNNDFRESTRFCGATEQARQIWWASGDTDTSGTSRLGWHHLSASRDHPGTDAYTFFRLETGAASYARNGMGKYTVVWTTGHASGYGLQIGHFGYYMHHSYSTIVVNEHIIHRERYSNGSYYGWDDSPGMRIINSSASGGTNACIVFRCGGRRHSGFDMGVVVGLFVDLYVPESANGDTNPRLYVAGNSQSNLSGGGFGNPVSHAYVSFSSNNPNHSGQP